MLTDRPSLTNLREARSKAAHQLPRFAGTVGTAIGAKKTNNCVTGQRAVVFFVDKKLPESRTRSNTIPKILNIGKRQVHTDVVELRGLKLQFGPPPHYCYDGVSQGTVASMCLSYGEYYATTCAHCIRGLDLDPHESSKMQLYDSAQNQYVTIGNSVYAVKSPGRGLPGNFGFSDVGLFTVHDANILAKCEGGSILKTWRYPSENTEVRTETPHGPLTGSIAYIEAQYGSVFSDIVISVQREGTFEGDSGCLWRTNNGLAVAMHALGSDEGDAVGSKLSFCMLAHRMCLELQAELIDIT